MKWGGPSLIVARRACNIIDQRDKRKTGAKTIPYKVDKSKCVAGSPPACQATCLSISISAAMSAPLKTASSDESLAIIKKTLPFPGIIGRVCTTHARSSASALKSRRLSPSTLSSRAATDFGKYTEDYTIAAEKKERLPSSAAGRRASWPLTTCARRL